MASIRVKQLGLQPYEKVWQQMQQFTRQRERPDTSQIWLVEHPAVFTQGLAGKPEHVLAPAEIPVIKTDRGGQVTYHGPGQLVVYVMLDLHDLGIGVRTLVNKLENSVIAFLAEHNIKAGSRVDAPGVYVAEKKIASLGLKIRKGFSYHGLSLNVDMDLEPFQRINPCGYRGLEVTQLRELGVIMTTRQAAQSILQKLSEQIDREILFDD